jgi:hypothetical protein
MKIIQSFSLVRDKYLPIEKYKYLYSMLLSYVSLKKHYGEVTMICDRNAYDMFLKYIPYDNVIFYDNPDADNLMCWSLYKVHVMKIMKEPFIHVDCDLFIHDDIFKEYIDGDYTSITQNYITKIEDFYGYYDRFIENDLQTFYDENIVSQDFKMGSISSGISGFKNIDSLDMYFEITDKIKKLYYDNKIFKNYRYDNYYFTIICEEFGYYIYLQNTKQTNHYALLTNGHVPQDFNNEYNFTHILGEQKFTDFTITKIKNIIYNTYPEHIEYLEKIDKFIKEKI